jgi:Fe-S-cluster-containing dehydrogenase component
VKNWYMIFDVDRCTNCRNCFISVLDEYAENEHPGYSKPIPRSGMKLLDIKTYEHGKGSDMSVAYVPVTCNNCEQAPCVRACGDGAVYKREDGIVMIDPIRAKGQRSIVSTCPYGHIWWNEQEQVPQLWTFDAHLLDQGWDRPRMVDACPTLAIEAVKTTAEDMEARVKSEDLQVLHPEYRTKPRIYYKHLDSALREFIAGSVLGVKDGKTDAIEGVDVRLFHNGEERSRTRTDFFGDFKFPGLEAKGAEYLVSVQPEGHAPKEAKVTLSASVRIESFIYTL